MPTSTPLRTGPEVDERAVRRPSLLYLAAEWPRAAAELTWLQAAHPVLATAPRGDGHPVLVLPGLVADDWSTRALRRYLISLGYHVHGWRLGRNVPSRSLLRRLRVLLDELETKDSRPLSIIGWSLGGLYARDFARMAPERVRQVITLGSPHRTSPGRESVVAPFMRAVVGWRGVPDRRPEYGNDSPLPVPSTSLFTRTDGVVPWQACLDTRGGRHESLEVISSHVGLGHHPAALWAIADRLAQPDGEWAPMHVPALWRPVLRPHPGR